MKIFRHILSALMSVLIVVMAAGTIVEKYHGSEYALSHVYGAWWFVALWGIAAAGMLFMIFQKQSWKRPVVCLLHISALLILLGALLTMLTGQHGEMTLHPGEANNVFKIEKNDESREVTLPFHLMLDRFEVVKYPGSRTPMDFVSHLQILDGGIATEATISMNNILKYKNYRFYQSDYDEEGNSVLAVAHDPWGIGVTYTGYLLLLVSLVAMFIVPNGRFRQLLKKTSAKAAVILVLLTAGCCMPALSANAPRTLPKESADKLGQLYVQYKGRVCPLQTLAKDFTTTLYGSARYHGLTSEQVLSGWMFYFDDWKDESISDKKYNLVLMLYNGELLKLYPHADSLGEVTWYSQNDVLPLDVSDGEYLFIRKQLSLCKEYVVAGDFKSLDEVLEKTKIYQEKNSQGLTQPKAQYRAERIYNRLTTGRWLAFVNIVLGLVFFAVSLICIGKGRKLYRPLRWFAVVWMALLGTFLALLFILRWVAGGHVPMAGSFDSMNLLALSICVLALILSRRH